MPGATVQKSPIEIAIGVCVGYVSEKRYASAPWRIKSSQNSIVVAVLVAVVVVTILVVVVVECHR